jgi:urea transport system permease protein
MVRLFVLLFILGWLHAAVAQEREAIESNSQLDELLLQLASANLNQSAALIPQLEEAGGRAILPLLAAMAAGNLYVHRPTLQWLQVDDNSLLTDIYSGVPVNDLAVADLDRIRLNNRLRVLLRDAIGRISLFEGTEAERSAAARNMFRDLGVTNLAILEQARESEVNEAVLELINVAIALNQLAEPGGERQARLDAVALLAGRLETPVRNLLNSLLDEQGRYEPDAEVRSAVQEALVAIERRVQLFRYVEEIFYGLSLGSVLLLAAIGLAVTFGVMGVINMAHGEMLMLGAYTTYVVQLLMPQFINQSLWVAIPAAFLVTALVGMLIQRFVIRYLNGRPLETLLATFGISLILQQAVRSIFSPLNRLVVSPDWMSGAWQINPALALTYNRLYILLFSIMVFLALLMVLKKTSLGLQVRAVSQNRAMASAMGIRTDWVDALTFGLGSGIAGIAGVALSQLTNVGPNMGQAYIIDSFMVVVFGGVGNLWGTLVGAFTLGISNKFLEPVTGAVLAKIFTLVFIIVFIQFRPKGLFPQKGRAAE